MIRENAPVKIRNPAGQPVIQMDQVLEHRHDDPAHQCIDHPHHAEVDHLHDEVFVFQIKIFHFT